MTPIYPGTARRLGLRKPLPPLEYVVEIETVDFDAAMRGIRAFVAEHERMISKAHEIVVKTMQRYRL